jgi:hypothetical protein
MKASVIAVDPEIMSGTLELRDGDPVVVFKDSPGARLASPWFPPSTRGPLRRLPKP